MKNLLLKILFWQLRKEYYKPLLKEEIDSLLLELATNSNLKKFPRYLEQCANTARNQYLYNNDQTLKGIIFALISLKNQIEKKRPKRKKELTQEEENVIMKKRGY